MTVAGEYSCSKKEEIHSRGQLGDDAATARTKGSTKSPAAMDTRSPGRQSRSVQLAREPDVPRAHQPPAQLVTAGPSPERGLASRAASS